MNNLSWSLAWAQAKDSKDPIVSKGERRRKKGGGGEGEGEESNGTAEWPAVYQSLSKKTYKNNLIEFLNSQNSSTKQFLSSPFFR